MLERRALDALLHLDGFCKEVDGRWYLLNERGETTNDGCPDPSSRFSTACGT